MKSIILIPIIDLLLCIFLGTKSRWFQLHCAVNGIIVYYIKDDVYNLLMRDLSEGQRARGTGGNLLMRSSDYKVYEGSPKLATQKIEAIDVDTVNTFLDIEKTQGRDRAYQFAQKVLSAGKVTNKLIEQAKKMNAPTWVVALMVSQQAMQGDE